MLREMKNKKDFFFLVTAKGEIGDLDFVHSYLKEIKKDFFQGGIGKRVRGSWVKMVLLFVSVRVFKSSGRRTGFWKREKQNERVFGDALLNVWL